MAEVNGWKDWLLWPLRRRFGTQSGKPPAQRDLGLDPWGTPWLYDEADFCRFRRVLKRDPRDDWLVEFERLPAGLPTAGFIVGSDGNPQTELFALEGRHVNFRRLMLQRHGIRPTETDRALEELERKQGLETEIEASPKVTVFPGA